MKNKNEYIVNVKYQNHTYLARYQGKTASATSGRERAACRVVSKVTNIPEYELRAEYLSDHVYRVMEKG